MQSANDVTSVRSPAFGWIPVILMLAMAFIFFTVAASISPLNYAMARYVLCPGAAQSHLQVASGGVVEKLGVQPDIGSRIVTLHCFYDGEPPRVIGNDLVVGTGFGAAVGLGALVGLGLYGAMRIQPRRRS